MATILRNDDAEALILDIRAGRRAAAEPIDGAAGAFLVFPTSVVTACPSGGQAVFPLKTGIEPGTFVSHGGLAEVSGIVDGVAVRGSFTWTDPEDETTVPVEPACYHFERRGRQLHPPPWADQLPQSRCILRKTPKALAREQAVLVRRGRSAEHWLLTLTERIVRQSCRGPIRLAIHHRSHVDVDDVVQRGLQTACRLLPVYASANRPPCSWIGMINLDGKRDMHREVCRLDWVPPRGRATAARGDVPSLTSLESLHPSLLEPAVARVPAELDAIDEQRGRAVAVVARLVGGDAEVIDLAERGDAGALKQVSKELISALAWDGETQAGTRRRCWAEFLSSGRLLATDAAASVFGAMVEPDGLAAVDGSLCEAAGLCGRASGTW